MLLLSERREHLKTLKTLFEEKDCEASLYVGGMKEKQLKDSEKAKVILSTYSMTSEGFDNPDLNTLVLASSKTDIEQSVGRILRKKHEITPIIIDIVDRFSLFTVQGYQRKYYYKNHNYKIEKISGTKVSTKSDNQPDTNMKSYAFIDDE